jgi:cyclopropane-fatty-acyl-phospholipid synthase
MAAHKTALKNLFSLAGIEINGRNPWDIRVHNEEFYRRILTQGSLGLGESYMDEWWDCERLDEFFYRVLHSDLEAKVKQNWKLLFKIIRGRLFNLNSKKRAFRIAEKHYNLGNELFRNMLDTQLTYSCAYWKDAHTLDEAQEKKHELICQKLNLKRGGKEGRKEGRKEKRKEILDIGCGWGGFAKYAAENHQVHVIGITVSKDQVEIGKELCRGLPIEIRLQDYRDVKDKFDHVVSMGMLEHVGYKNHRTYFEVVHRCLKEEGLFLLQTIGRNKSATSTDPWLNKYIFPDGMVPSIKQIGASIEGLFVMEDWQNLSINYDKTLMAWYENFNRNWNKIKSKYDDRFYRMWKYYLLSCAGSFRARNNQLWQVLLSKKGIPEGYKAIR